MPLHQWLKIWDTNGILQRPAGKTETSLPFSTSIPCIESFRKDPIYLNMVPQVLSGKLLEEYYGYNQQTL